MTIQRCIHLVNQSLLRRYVLSSSMNHETYCKMKYIHSSSVKNRKFTDRHEWVTAENNIGTIGISKYAQESLGDVVFAQLPDPGEEIKAGDECGALESVKAASELYSPVSGTVTEKNSNVEKKPGLINSSCYDKGWLFKVKLSNSDELNDLMTEAQYETFLKTDTEKEKNE